MTSILGALVGYYIFQQQKTLYTAEQVYELNSENTSGEEKILLTEEVVALLRERSPVDSDVQHLYISRIPHYAVKVIIHSDNPQTNSENLSNISHFISERGAFEKIGEQRDFTQSPSILLFTVCGIISGLFLGVIISLMKTFWKYY